MFNVQCSIPSVFNVQCSIPSVFNVQCSVPSVSIVQCSMFNPFSLQTWSVLICFFLADFYRWSNRQCRNFVFLSPFFSGSFWDKIFLYYESSKRARYIPRPFYSPVLILRNILLFSFYISSLCFCESDLASRDHVGSFAGVISGYLVLRTAGSGTCCRGEEGCLASILIGLLVG